VGLLVYLGILFMGGAIMTYLDPAAFSDASTDGFHLRAVAKRVLEDRLKRKGFFPSSLFGEAAWDAILILFCAEQEMSNCAESLALRLDLPLTTMGRWLAVLENEGLIEVQPKSLLSEREALRLSVSGRNAVQAYLRARTNG
jgi:DNA-binding transcriptional ArsR family regulator